MKKLLALVLTCCLLTLAPLSAHFNGPPAPASAPPADACSTDNDTFSAGERVVYKLFYKLGFVWIPAGEVVFQVNELPKQYHVTVTGKTYDSYEWVYSATNHYESYLDKETLLPILHIKDIKEHSSNYSRYDRTTFYPERGYAKSERGKTRDALETKRIPIEACMHDLVSIIYYARNLEFDEMRKNKETPIKVFMDQEIHPLSIKYLGEEKNVRVKDGGRYNTHVFSPTLVAGEVFKEGDEMKIWVSDDENKLPLIIESPVVVGSVQAVLKSHKGLRHPLTAQLK